MLDVDAVADSFSNIGRTFANVMNGIIKIFQDVWDAIKDYIPVDIYNKNISRKRFIKLLMSYKIQRNDANKIANELHKQKGMYKLGDICKYVGGLNEN